MMKHISNLAGILLAVFLAPSFGQTIQKNADSKASANSLANQAYDAFPLSKLEGSAPITNGTDILNLGLKAFLEFPQDARAETTLTFLTLLPDRLSKTDLAPYERDFHERISALLARPDIPGGVREGLLYLDASNEMGVQSIHQKTGNADIEAFRKKLDALEAIHPQTPWIASHIKWLESASGDFLTATDLPAAKDFWTKQVAGADQELAEIARGKLNVIEMKQGHMPVQIKFTAADGRQVDFAALRGKVVLIDFWATWCPLCLTELPEIRAAYETYHKQGFEIISIACEDAHLQSTDPEEARNKALDGAKTKLLTFVAAHTMPWPQYFDGRGLDQNDYAHAFGVTGLPAIFLFDQTGKLVQTNLPVGSSDIGPLVEKLLVAGNGASDHKQ